MTSYPVTFSTVSSALATLFDDRIVNQIQRASVLLQLIPKEPMVGKNVTWDAEILPSGVSAVVNAGPIADGSAVTDYSNDTYAPATLAAATYNNAFQVSGQALATAANTGNPADLENLFGRKILEASKMLALSINNDLFTGASGVGIQGLTSALLASGTYAGVSIASYPGWASNILANGGTPRPLTLQLMRSAVQAVYQSSDQHPDLIVMNPRQWNEYASLMTPNRFLMQEVVIRGQKIVLDGGFRALDFDGVPVVQDNSCPAGTVFFLTTENMALRVLPDSVGAMLGMATRETDVQGDWEDQFGEGATQIKARIQPLAVLGDAYPFQLLTYLQLQVKRPNAFAVLSDLS